MHNLTSQSAATTCICRNGADMSKKITALYLRISREDGNDESYSISNQKKLLTDWAKKLGFTKILYFIDDGVTDRKSHV